MDVRLTVAFYRSGALCGFLAAALVLLVQYGLSGYPSPGNREEYVALLSHPAYRAQGAALLAQVILMFFALWAAGLRALPHAPGAIAAGLVALLFWQVLEIVPRGVEVFTLPEWAAAHQTTADPAEREALSASIRTADGMLAGLGGVRRIFWALGNLLFAAAFLRWPGWARAAGVLFLANALRLVLGELAGRLGWGWYGEAAIPLFVALAVPLFAVLGIWLWRRETSRPIAEAPG